MAYTDQLDGVILGANLDLSSTGSKATRACGYQPFVVRAVTIIYRTEPTATGTLELRLRPTAGSASGETAVATLNAVAADAIGGVLYKDQLNVKVLPGQELNAQVTSAFAGVTSADIQLTIDPSWDVPGNRTAMRLTA